MMEENPRAEWHRVVFIYRASWCSRWSLIEQKLELYLQRRIPLLPVGEDRAILICDTEEEKRRLLNEAKLVGGEFIAKILAWQPELHWSEAKWGGTNVWIWIQGLPLNTWKEEHMRSIGARF